MRQPCDRVARAATGVGEALVASPTTNSVLAGVTSPGPWPGKYPWPATCQGRRGRLASMLRTLRFQQGYFTYSTGGPGGGLTPPVV